MVVVVELEEGGVGGALGERHNLVSFTPIYMDTLGQWKSFPFEDGAKGVKRLGRRNGSAMAPGKTV